MNVRKQWLRAIIMLLILAIAMVTQSSIRDTLNIQVHKWWLLFIVLIVGIAVSTWLIKRKKKDGR